MVDPAHPLYGQRFPLISVSHPPNSQRQALVIYQNDIMVRIPLCKTNLSHTPPVLSKVKLSIDALVELAEIAQQLKIIAKKGGLI
ncbi:MAG: hypothetical protein WBG37_07215 [Desulfobacterales bacterium]